MLEHLFVVLLLQVLGRFCGDLEGVRFIGSQAAVPKKVIATAFGSEKKRTLLQNSVLGSGSYQFGMLFMVQRCILVVVHGCRAQS